MGIGEGKARSSIGSAALTPAIQIERASRPAKSRLSMLSHSQRRIATSKGSRRDQQVGCAKGGALDGPLPPTPPPLRHSPSCLGPRSAERGSGGEVGGECFRKPPKGTSTPHDRRQGEACGSGDTRPSLRSSFRRGGGRRESVEPARRAARRPGGGDRKQTGCCASGPGRGGGSSGRCGRPRWRRSPRKR